MMDEIKQNKAIMAQVHTQKSKSKLALFQTLACCCCYLDDSSPPEPGGLVSVINQTRGRWSFSAETQNMERLVSTVKCE